MACVSDTLTHTGSLESAHTRQGSHGTARHGTAQHGTARPKQQAAMLQVQVAACGVRTVQ
jgi:hypothetical protein